MKPARAPIGGRLLFGALLAAVAAGCFIGTDGFGMTPCTSDTDCTPGNAYWCVSTAGFPQRPCGVGEQNCSCEAVFPPPPTYADGGAFDAGPAPDWCTEIKPIMNTQCLFTCHGPQMGYPQTPMDFRLD